MSIELTDENYARLVEGASKPLLVMFMSTACGPTHAMFPLVDQMFEEGENRFIYAEVDVEKCPKMTRAYQVKGIPTLIFFAAGKPLGSRIGTMTPAFLQQFVDDMVERATPPTG